MENSGTFELINLMLDVFVLVAKELIKLKLHWQRYHSNGKTVFCATKEAFSKPYGRQTGALQI